VHGSTGRCSVLLQYAKAGRLATARPLPARKAPTKLARRPGFG
jgi:hypothetical protein